MVLVPLMDLSNCTEFGHVAYYCKNDFWLKVLHCIRSATRLKSWMDKLIYRLVCFPVAAHVCLSFLFGLTMHVRLALRYGFLKLSNPLFRVVLFSGVMGI